MEQGVILRLRLRQTTSGRHQPRLLQLLPGFRLGQQHVHFRLAIGAGLRRNLFQLIQLLLCQRLIPLPQGQPHARRNHIRVVRIHQFKPVERLANQFILITGFTDAHLLQQPLLRRDGFCPLRLRQHCQT